MNNDEKYLALSFIVYCDFFPKGMSNSDRDRLNAYLNDYQPEVIPNVTDSMGYYIKNQFCMCGVKKYSQLGNRYL